MNKKTTHFPSQHVKKTGKAEIAKVSFFENNQVIYLLLGLVVLFVIIARVYLLSFPLERDEGEYAYIGKLILDGHAPYSQAYNMKYPGTYYMYALIMAVFGQSTIGIHLGLLVVVVASTILMFFIAKNFVSKIGAVIAAASFGIIGTSWGMLAQAAHATHFVAFFALLGIYFILQKNKEGKHNILKYLLSGVFFSFAFICKQSGLFFVFFGYTVILINEFSFKPWRIPLKNLLFFTSGFVAPVLLMFFAFYLFGIFDKFWFWTATYLSKYGTNVPIADVSETFKMGINAITVGYSSEGYIVLWLIALMGVPITFFIRKTTKQKLIILSLFLFSFLTTVPGFYFRNHYFITLLPIMALLVALFFDFFNQLFLEKLKQPYLVFVSFFVFLIIVGFGVKANENYLFKVNNKTFCKHVYGVNPFVESIKLGEYLKRNTAPEDKIAIFGSEPQILFYANRYSATGYIYTYSLMENHSYAAQMQKEMINEIEQNNPKYFIFVTINISWLSNKDSDKTIFTWANEYIQQHYKLVGFMDVMPHEIAPLNLDVQLNTYQPKGQIIYLLERLES